MLRRIKRAEQAARRHDGETSDIEPDEPEQNREQVRERQKEPKEEDEDEEPQQGRRQRRAPGAGRRLTIDEPDDEI